VLAIRASKQHSSGVHHQSVNLRDMERQCGSRQHDQCPREISRRRAFFWLSANRSTPGHLE
jgi:hypothetical protein